MSDALFAVHGLSCVRGDRTLFAGLSLTLDAGEAVHVRGPNGLGKTTLLRALCGLSRPMRGEIRWRGERISDLAEEFTAEVAYVGHLNGIQGELTAAENLRLASRVFTRRGCAGHSEGEALARVGLRAQADRPARHLSQGQKRRLALARLLVLRRPLWVLDEPFTALDVASVASLSSLIGEHMAAGGLALVVSHQAFDLPGIRDFELARYCRTRR
ncbi:MAG: cytochrome c biogenesis heme-transporting ATPase CcmA [Gammaproteobacteria bacterium]|jgi:heme exporter protein A|nr:cytochrome c biogenesis heme-transporting ATPase CcmA [Gammaproteobacteria bacterium]